MSGVGGELGELAAPEVGAQDALGRHPLGVDGSQGLDGTGILAAVQHPIEGFEIADGGAFRRWASASAALRMVVMTSAVRTGRVLFSTTIVCPLAPMLGGSMGLSMLWKTLRSGPGALPPELCQATLKTEPLPTSKTEPPLGCCGVSLSE